MLCHVMKLHNNNALARLFACLSCNSMHITELRSRDSVSHVTELAQEGLALNFWPKIAQKKYLPWNWRDTKKLRPRLIFFLA
jgi:hypothetical protein